MERQVSRHAAARGTRVLVHELLEIARVRQVVRVHVEAASAFQLTQLHYTTVLYTQQRTESIRIASHVRV